MVKRKSEYPQKKFGNKEYNSVEEIDSFHNDKIAPKLDKNLDLLFNQTIATLKENKDFLKKMTDEANEQMSRSTFKVTPK